MSVERYRFERYELQPAERRLLVDGQPAAIGARAFDVLMVLVERRGRVVTKGELLDAAWPGVVVEENNLAVQVSTLRKVLGTQLIATVAGRGYQFTGELQPIETAPAAPPATGSAPVAATRIVGRDAELAALDELAANNRLVTIAGAGGIGKTRLAQAWCEATTARGGAVVWVELAGLSDISLLPATVLAALGVGSGSGGASPLAALREVLPTRRLTLVLDNAEPFAAEVASLARTLLEASPGLRLLVTSQVPLRLQAEHVFRVPTLRVPEGRATPLQALAHGAVALFVERARAVDPQFELATGNVTSVVEICRRLDGLPLALELAAARVPSLGVNALAAALDERLRVLGEETRSAPARQRTLRAALEWSHGLLDRRAQLVFRRLGVFAGGFTLAAAQRVLPGGGDELDAWAVMNTLGRLVEDSLVAKDNADPPRYALLESARLYALEQLERAAETTVLRSRHLAWGAAFVDEAMPAAVAGAVDAVAASRIGVEYPNLRAALEFALAADGNDRAIGAALAVALVPYWKQLEDDDERRRWLEPSAAPEPAPTPTASESTVARLLDRLKADGLVGGRSDGVDAGTVIALARRLGADDVRDFDAALKELGRAVDIASRVLSGGATDDGAADAFVGDVLAGVAERTRLGDFDRGADALDEALAELERRDAERQAAMRRSRRALLEAGVQQDLLRRDPFAVARRIEAIAALDAAQAPTRAAAYLEREAAFLGEGLDQAVKLSLAVGIEMLRRRIADAAAAAAGPGDAAASRDAQRRLVGALVVRGERDGDNESLREAVQVCRAALAEVDRDLAPLEWAALQHELASALRALGDREGNNAMLEEAAQYCREALKERTRDRAPLDWAETQHLLGSVLSQLAPRDSGTLRFAAAVAALRESLKERTRARTPLLWGRTQRLIAVALSRWGRREGGLARHHEAVEALRAALTVVTRERAPLEWGRLQNNLGIELATIGEREDGIETLQAAVDAYREALRETTRERSASVWAAAQHNLGGALRLLGERETGTQSLREGVLAFREALKENTRESAPAFWAAGMNDMALALIALGKRESGTASLEQAVRALHEALEERRREETPVDWATTQTDLSKALFELAARRDDATGVRQAVASAELALQELPADAAPDQHADARGALDRAHGWLAQREATAR